jgi:hypothetical protein
MKEKKKKCRKEGRKEFGEGTPWNWRWVYEERGRNVCCGCFTDVVGKRAVERIVECGRKKRHGSKLQYNEKKCRKEGRKLVNGIRVAVRNWSTQVERIVECGRQISVMVRNCGKMRRSAGRKE